MYFNTQKGSKPGTIILLHGNSSSSKIYNPLFESNIEYSLLSYDLYGHGKSTHNGNYSLTEMKEQLFSIINDIDEDIILVGHSLGGHIAMEVALQIKNLKGLVVFGSPPVRKPVNIEDVYHIIPEVAVLFTAEPSKEQIENAFNTFSKNETINSILVNDFLLTDPSAREVFAAQTGEFSNELEILHQLSCPKIMIHGELDPLLKMEYLEKNKDYGGYDIEVIEDCGHYISLEKSDQFNRIIIQFSSNIFN